MTSCRAALLVVALVAGCGGSPGDARIRVEPHRSTADEPVRIEVDGLRPGGRATIALRSTDAAGVSWASSAEFTADAEGRLRLDEAVATSLIASMDPVDRGFAAYRWPEEETRPLRFALTVRADGGSAASTTFRRRLSTRRLAWRRLSLAVDGIAGFFVARDRLGRRAAVVLVGGSEGGVPTGLVAAVLAGRGHQVLGVAYWRSPGLPESLASIPLEYFAGALEWLHAQPRVGPVVVVGVSRGSEAALLLGAHFPHLVDGVVAVAPNSVALCSHPACTGPAWTLSGGALPYTRQFDSRAPTDVPEAILPVERIDAPVALVCGGSDRVWSSCAHARAIASRMRAAGRPPPLLHAYPDAGHGLGGLVPYQPRGDADVRESSDERASADLWPRLLAFLADVEQR